MRSQSGIPLASAAATTTIGSAAKNRKSNAAGNPISIKKPERALNYACQHPRGLFVATALVFGLSIASGSPALGLLGGLILAALGALFAWNVRGIADVVAGISASYHMPGQDRTATRIMGCGVIGVSIFWIAICSMRLL
jgi:hypothetical protein